jgi:hypothetical protein
MSKRRKVKKALDTIDYYAKVKTKTVEWISQNWYQRLQTSWVFIRASWRMLRKGRVSISVDFLNL